MIFQGEPEKAGAEDQNGARVHDTVAAARCENPAATQAQSAVRTSRRQHQLQEVLHTRRLPHIHGVRRHRIQGRMEGNRRAVCRQFTFLKLIPFLVMSENQTN